MQQFVCVENQDQSAAYVPLHGFTVADLGYQTSNAISNMINRLDEADSARTYLQLFDKIWGDTLF